MADPGAGATGQAAGLINRQDRATWTQPLGAPPQVPPSKFRLPRLPPGVIDRPRLTTRLVGSDAALFLVSAPAGSGKSTLLTQWAERDPRRFAYLWLESSENDPAALWTGIIESLRQVLPGFGADAESMLLSVGGLALDVVVRRVAAELDGLTDPVVLVLDDYQVIRSTACHESLELLVAQHLRGLHVVLSSRVDRPIRLARTRASGQLTETGLRDLAFTLEETTAVLSQGGPAPPAAAARLVQERTEGWPAGVRLVALGLRESGDPEAFLASYDGSSRHVADYLREVVLGPLTEDVRGFLVETSVLRRLTAGLCDAVTGRADSAEVLRELDRQNLFVVPLDDHRVWCRYHHLFADLLTEELVATPPARLSELHRAASRWYAAAGDTGDAIEHAVAGEDLEGATDLVLGGWTQPMFAGRVTTVSSWLAAFPRAHVRDAGSLSVVAAWTHALQGHRGEALDAVADVLRAGCDRERMPDGTSRVEHAVALLRSTMPWGDVTALQQAVDLIPEFREDLRPEFGSAAAFSTGLAAFLSGRSEEASGWFARSVTTALDTGTWLVAVDAMGLEAQLALVEGRAADAEELATRALDHARSHGLADLPRTGYLLATLGSAVARDGRVEEGDRYLARGVRQFGQGDPLLAAHIAMMRAPVRRRLGDHEGARALLEQAKGLLARCPDPGFIGGLVPQLERSLATAHRRGDRRTDVTDRELDVLRLLAKGLSKREIAHALFLSYNTIHTHTRSIYARLDASSRSEAVARARALDLL